MRLKIKKMEISTQGHNVCLLNSEDANELNIRNIDRVFLKSGSKSSYAVVDITNTNHFIKRGEIGIFNEIYEELSLKSGKYIHVEHFDKPITLNLIKKKLDGRELNDSEIYSVVSDISSSKLSEVEIAHFISGCYCAGISLNEISSLTNAFVNTGQILKFDKYPLVNLKFIGALSHTLYFIIASVISSLKIGFIGVLDDDTFNPSNFKYVFDSFGMKSVSSENASSTLNRYSCLFISKDEVYVTPGVDKIKKIEHPISAYSYGITAASILSETKSFSASHSFICIVYGDGRPVKDINSAKELKVAIIKASKKLRLKVGVLIIDGNFPWEKNIGYFESKDVILALKNDTLYSRIIDISTQISGDIIELVGRKNGKKIAKEIIKSGQALDQFRKIVKYYNGNTILRDSLDGINTIDIKASKNGFVSSVNSALLAKASIICGSQNYKNAGISIRKNRHDRVLKGEKLLTLYSPDKKFIDNAKQFISKNDVVHIT